MSEISNHPTDDELRSFAAGALDEAAGQIIQDHVSACESCTQRVGELSEGDDTFLEFLKQIQPADNPQRDRAAGITSTRSIRNPAEKTQTYEPVAESQLESGATVGKYQVIDVLGRGSFGTVYRARDPEADRQVAVKVMRSGIGEQGVRRFLREAKSASSLNHRNICPVYDFAHQGETPYIVMELIEGQTLREFLDAGKKVSVRQAVLAVYKLSSALIEAHAQGIVHRDLKPDNIMFDHQNKELVVLDFGLARNINDAGSQLTSTGDILGTPVYMSPEQVRGDLEHIGPQTDVYSLGVILYELIAGRRPFVGNMSEVFAHILHKDPKPPSTLCSELPKGLDAICLKAIAKQLDRRFQTAAEFRAALVDYSKGKIILENSLENEKAESEFDWSPKPQLKIVPQEDDQSPTLHLANDDVASSKCRKCGAPMDSAALMCNQCGYHLGLHKQLSAFAEPSGSRGSSPAQNWLAQHLNDDESPESFARLAVILFPTLIVVSLVTLYVILGTWITLAATLIYLAIAIAIGRFIGVQMDWQSLVLIQHRLRGWRRFWPPAKRKTLNMRGTMIRDEDLRELRQDWNLEVLDLEDTQITDGAIEFLAPLHSLRFLILRGTQVSDAGYLELKQRLSQTRIWA